MTIATLVYRLGHSPSQGASQCDRTHMSCRSLPYLIQFDLFYLDTKELLFAVLADDTSGSGVAVAFFVHGFTLALGSDMFSWIAARLLA